MPFRKPQSSVNQKPPPGATVDWAHPLSRGLLMWWLLNEGAGQKANDSARRYLGTLTSNPTWTQGRFGPALKFDGSTNYVINSSIVTGGLATCSMSVWFKTTTSQNNTYIFALPDDSTGSNRLDITLTTTQIQAHCDTTVEVIPAFTVTYTDNVWRHVALVYDGAAAKLYVNGLQKDSQAITGAILNTAAATECNLGRFGSFGGFFTGSADDARIWNRALTAAEVLTLYSTPFVNLVAPKRRIISAVVSAAAMLPRSYQIAQAVNRASTY